MPRSNLLNSIALLAAVSLSILPISSKSVRAQGGQPLPFQYAVKFICGKSPFRKEPPVVARGTYFTAINVHNPLVEKVEFRKKLAIPLPGKDTVITRFFPDELLSDGALDIGCLDILKMVGLGDDPRFLKGFVVIESRTELDVVAVYTAAGFGGFFSRGQVETMEIERVPARRLGQPDLVPVSDATGNFCRRDPAGQLIITVRNQGTIDATPSITRLDFATGENLGLATPSIPAGASVDVFATIPPACFKPDCTFRIAVDSTGLVGESNEGNNAAGGTCGALR